MQSNVNRSPPRDSIRKADFLHGASEIKSIRDSHVAARLTLDIVMASVLLLREMAAPMANEISSDEEGNIKAAPKELDEESDAKEWRGTFKELLRSYCIAIDTEDTDKKTKKIKHLENFEAIPVKFRDVLAEEIWRTVNGLKAKRKNWTTHQGLGKKPSERDINSLTNLYAKCFASVAQE
jgi:hypothetical protein